MGIDPKDIPFDPLDEVLEVPNPLQIEFNALVRANHRFSLEGIAREEENDRLNLDDDAFRYQQTYFDDLRTAANNLAIVALVTRIDHWVTRYSLKIGMGKKGSTIDKVERLNERFKGSPVPIKFFKDLVDSRDSVIHGNSKSEWEYRVMRKISNEHKNFFGELEISSAQVEEAIAKSVEQLSWYEDQITKV
ncbi:MAG TPA: hypothetical protein VFK06_00315 [Candidatus Angelobacter sp.]|nr:hypothetical protein [Candidatus Angelobacter sp.]